MATFPVPDFCCACAFSADGSEFAVHMRDGILFRDLATGREEYLPVGETSVHVRSMAFFPDGERLAVVPYSGVVIWGIQLWRY